MPAAAKGKLRRFAEFPLVALILGLLAVAVFFLLASVITVAIGLAAGVLSASDPSSFARMPGWLASLSGILAAISAVLAVKVLIKRIGATPRDDLPFDGRARDFFRGIGIAFLLMSAIVGLAALLGGYRISGWGGSTSLAFLICVAGFQAAFFEEVLLRGVIFRFLEEFAGSWIAIAISALIFGFLHYSNPNGTALAALAIAVEAGVLLAGAYMLTRNLWLAVGLHWGWNVTQGYVWDVPVSGLDTDGILDAHPAGSDLISGGAFGLEASLVAMTLATVFGVWLVIKAARRGHVVQPWWVRRRAARTDAA